MYFFLSLGIFQSYHSKQYLHYFSCLVFHSLRYFPFCLLRKNILCYTEIEICWDLHWNVILIRVNKNTLSDMFMWFEMCGLQNLYLHICYVMRPFPMNYIKWDTCTCSYCLLIRSTCNNKLFIVLIYVYMGRKKRMFYSL